MTYNEENAIWIDSFDLSYNKKIKLLKLFDELPARKLLKEKKVTSSVIVTDKEFNTLLKATDDSYLVKLLKEYENKNITVLTLFSNEYPALLKEISSPPVCLYCKGNLQLLNSICCAVVGTRKPTEYGSLITKQFVTDLSNAGVTIVSGMASGVDTIAHEQTVKNNGSTIAVLAGGFDYIYPTENIYLYKRLIQNNLVVSEYRPNVRAASFTFPLRNRIIAGLSRAVLITEAGLQSGALHTKNYAIEFNREVFAIPGRINSPESEGTNSIIKECQSCLCLSVDQITDYLGVLNKKNDTNVAFQLDITEQTILNYILTEKKTYQEIADYTKLPARELNTVLFNMQLKGYIEKLVGNAYISLIKLK